MFFFCIKKLVQELELDPYQNILALEKNCFVSTTVRPASALCSTPAAQAAAQTSRSTRT
jgi:hypothetical protein